jgi:hypothetical protein
MSRSSHCPALLRILCIAAELTITCRSFIRYCNPTQPYRNSLYLLHHTRLTAFGPRDTCMVCSKTQTDSIPDA